MKRPIWILCLVSLGGCGSQPVTKPSEVTLVEAMKQVGTGLAEMRKAQGDLRTGLIAESVDVTFAIAAGSEQGSALKIDLAAPVVHEGATLGGEITGKSTSSRANTITIKFKNLLTVPKDTVATLW